MDLQDYVRQAALTDQVTGEAEAMQVALFGIVGEAGEVVSAAKKYVRDGVPLLALQDRISEEIGDLLWYMAKLSRELGLDLDSIATQNLSKTRQIWTSDLPPLPDYDDHDYEEQKIPRQFTIEFTEDTSGKIPIVRMIPKGVLAKRFDVERERARSDGQLGDPLDDNTAHDDGYRYHDIIHLGHATVLGWSPVFRALTKAKRRDVEDYDRVQDGARAIFIEEGLAAFVFSYMESFEFDPSGFGWDLYRHIQRTVRSLEVANQPFVAWRHTYQQVFDIFQQLHASRGGIVECDLDARKLRLVE